jgi:hypothetical protein
LTTITEGRQQRNLKAQAASVAFDEARPSSHV